MANNSFEKEILQLVKQNKSLKKEVAKLKKENAELNSKIDSLLALREEVLSAIDVDESYDDTFSGEDSSEDDSSLRILVSETLSLDEDDEEDENDGNEEETYEAEDGEAGAASGLGDDDIEEEEEDDEFAALDDDEDEDDDEVSESSDDAEDDIVEEEEDDEFAALDDDDEEEEEDDEDDEESVPENPAPPEPPEPGETYGIFPYTNDIYQMDKNEFAFNFSVINVKEDDENKKRVDIMSVPLTTKIKYPPVLLWVITETGPETVVLKDGANRAKLSYGGINFELSCKMVGSAFRTYIDVQGYDSEQTDIRTKNNGEKGHLYLEFEDKHIHICPVSFKNNAEALADFVYCIEQDGHYLVAGDNMNGHVIVEDSAGRQKDILAKWQDASLYGAILDVV